MHSISSAPDMSPRVAPERTAAANDPKVQALVSEFIQDKRREVEAEAKARSSGMGRHILVGLLAAVCIAAWIAPYPAATAPAPVDPKVERASSRMTLFLAAQSVTHFRAVRGRLPTSLAEAGVESALIVFNPGLDGSFTLSTHVRGQSVSYDSSVPLQSFLGQAEEVISQTGH